MVKVGDKLLPHELEYLKRGYFELFIEEIHKPKYRNMIEYIEKIYMINIPQLLNILKKNIKVKHIDNSFLIMFNSIDVQIKNNKINTGLILRTINDGNFEIKGTNILSNLRKYIEKNDSKIILYYTLKVFGK